MKRPAKIKEYRLPVARLLVTVAFVCALVVCRDPFFPTTGTPDPVPPLRATPAGTIEQLMEAYESRNIYLFEDLFPPARTFQFYVSPSFVSIYKSRTYVNPPEPRDTRLQYIGEYPYYYYWTQNLEIQSAKNLFAKSEAIEIKVPPNVNPGDFKYTVDGNGDTVNVEVLMTDGQILIKINTGTIVEQYTIAIERQVFFLERDESHLWVIRKWYDFGSQQ